jgi:hypothetical protein
MRVFLLIVAVIASAALILGQVNNLARSFTGSRLLHNGYGEIREASIRAAFWRVLELSRSCERPGGLFCLPVC